MQVNVKIVEQYEQRMGDYRERESCVVLNLGYGMQTQCPEEPVLEDKVFIIPV